MDAEYEVMDQLNLRERKARSGRRWRAELVFGRISAQRNRGRSRPTTGRPVTGRRTLVLRVDAGTSTALSAVG